MSKHSIKHTLALVLGLAVPVMALTGCPLPFFGGTTPSPSPTAAPAGPAKLVVTALKFGSAAGDHRIWIKNVGGETATLNDYAFSNQYRKTADSKKSEIPHKRFGKDKTLAAGATASVNPNGTSCTDTADAFCVYTEAALGGAAVTILDLQATQGGAVGLHKGVAAVADFDNKDKFVDFVQYGTKPADGDYDHAAAAVSATKWDAVANYVAAASGGKTVSRKTETAYASTAWELK